VIVIQQKDSSMLKEKEPDPEGIASRKYGKYFCCSFL
jgi:hypothetical protein